MASWINGDEPQGWTDLRSVETWPECFDLKLGEKLTPVWSAPATGEGVQVNFINKRKLVLWPNVKLNDLVILLDRGSAERREAAARMSNCPLSAPDREHCGAEAACVGRRRQQEDAEARSVLLHL